MQGKFYTIKPSTDTSEIGDSYPQAGMTLEYDKYAFNSFRNLKSFQLPDFTPNLDHFFLDERAKLTDLISGSMICYGLLLNTKFKNLLQNFSIQSHTIFKAFIKSETVDEIYHWLHFGPNEIIDQIYYPGSTFYVKMNLLKKETIKLESYEDYWSKLKKLNYKAIKRERLVLRQAIEYDLFVIPFFDGQIYISESLKIAIEKAKISGVQISQSKGIVFHSASEGT